MERNVAPADIKLVQQILTSFGYECGVPTGVVDGKTRISVIDYQLDHKQESTGWIDVTLVMQLKKQAAVGRTEK